VKGSERLSKIAVDAIIETTLYIIVGIDPLALA